MAEPGDNLSLDDYHRIMSDCGCCWPDSVNIVPQSRYRDMQFVATGYLAFDAEGEDPVIYCRKINTRYALQTGNGSSERKSTRESDGFVTESVTIVSSTSQESTLKSEDRWIATAWNSEAIYTYPPPDELECSERIFETHSHDGTETDFDAFREPQTITTPLAGTRTFANAIVDGVCKLVTTTTGDTISYGLPSTGGGDTENNDDEGACDAASIVLTQVLESRTRTISDSSESTYAGTKSTYVSSATIQTKRTLEEALSAPLTKEDFASWLDEQWANEDVWFTASNWLPATTSFTWPAAPELDPDETCPPVRGARASGSSRAIQYRWRVPCLGVEVRIEWDEVFFPKPYTDWIASIPMADHDKPQNWPPPPVEVPVVTPRSYVHPQQTCDEETTETFSPWGITVFVPAIQPGVIVLKNVRWRAFGGVSPWAGDLTKYKMPGEAETYQELYKP